VLNSVTFGGQCGDILNVQLVQLVFEASGQFLLYVFQLGVEVV
jgi:hypothetical protein